MKIILEAVKSLLFETVKSLYREFVSLPYFLKLSCSPYLVSSYRQGKLIRRSLLSSIVSDIPSLNASGICNGLCMDYARHIVNHKDSEIKADYVAKLRRKFTVFGNSSKNFAKRIEMYQNFHTTEHCIDVIDALNLIKNKRFINSLPNKLNTSKVIGVAFNGKGFSHIIAIEIIKNRYSMVVGYKIFDPNFGEFDCSKSKKAAENRLHCNELISQIYQIYQIFGSEECKVVDLEKVVTEYEFIKPKDKSKYNSKHKYIDSNPNVQFFRGKQLVYESFEGSLQKIRSLLALGADVNQELLGYTPLDIAIKMGNKEIVQMLMANPGIEINKKCNGYTPLFCAWKNGKKEIFQMLLNDPRVDVRIKNQGYTLLGDAAQFGSTGLEPILFADSRTNINEKSKGYPPLYIAAKNGDKEMVQILLSDPSVNVNEKCYGNTPLYIAAKNGDEEMVRMLLSDPRTIVNDKSRRGAALDIAIKNEHKEIENMILAACLKTEVIKSIKPFGVNPGLCNKISDHSKDVQKELARQVELDVKKLSKQGKGLNIKMLISVFPEENRMECFADSARKAIIECASKGKGKKVDMILESFSNQQDRNKILNSALLTPFTPRSKPLLVNLKSKSFCAMVSANFSKASSAENYMDRQ